MYNHYQFMKAIVWKSMIMNRLYRCQVLRLFVRGRLRMGLFRWLGGFVNGELRVTVRGGFNVLEALVGFWPIESFIVFFGFIVFN